MFGHKKESNEQIRQRILSLCEQDKDYGICPPPMDAQTALNEISKHLLGENWCVNIPISQEQVNTEIVFAIEERYKRIK